MGLTARSLIIDLLGLGAQHRGDLRRQVLDLDRAHLLGRGPIAGVDGEEGRPCVSPTKRMPSGPKASGPADLIWGLPFFRLAVGSPARAAAAVMIMPAVTRAATRVHFLVILVFSLGVNQIKRNERSLQPRIDVAALWARMAGNPRKRREILRFCRTMHGGSTAWFKDG